MRKKLSAIVICFIVAFVGIFTFSACSSFWDTEFNRLYDGMWYRICYQEDDGDAYLASTYFKDNDSGVRDVHYIVWSVEDTPVKVLGYVPIASSYVDPIVYDRNHSRVNNVYCPGSIERCEDGYFRTYYADDTEMPFHIFYCGAVIDLSEAGYGSAIVYYVPSAQLEEYCALWQENREGAICAANIEYLLNSEGMEEYYYIDYVAEGGTIENIPPEPTREGYDFMGWFMDETGTQEYDFSQPINAEGQESLKLFAKWQKKYYI